MHLDLGNYLCQYCGSSAIRCTEWQTDNEPPSIEDWYFSTEIESYTQDNLTGIGEAKLLFRCDECSRYFVIDIVPRGIDEVFLPFVSSEIERRIIVEFDPHSGDALTAYVGRVPLVIHEFTPCTPGVRAPCGPFYPYPQGRFRLAAGATPLPEGQRCFFRVEVDAPYPPLILARRESDVAVYQFSVSWADPQAAAVLRLLQPAKSFQHEDLIGSNAAIHGLPALQNSLAALRTDAAECRQRISQSAASARSSAAFRFFAWFEQEVRNFVWFEYTNLRAADSTEEDWWQELFPKPVRVKILQTGRNERRLKRDLSSRSPLDYADFGHLMELIEHIWPELNKRIDSDLDALRGHFRYLRAVRNSVAHARQLSHEDLMLVQDHALRFTELLEFQDLARKLEAPFYRRPSIL